MSMDGEIFTVIGIGVTAAVIAVVLRQAKPEYALLVSLGAGILILYRLLFDITPVAAEMQEIIRVIKIPAEYARILFKALGMCMLTQVACDTCKDAGETAIATKLEMAGRIGILVISLPLFTRILSIVSSLIS